VHRAELAAALHNLAYRLAGLGRREEALAAAEEATAIRRELAARWPKAHRSELKQSLGVVAWLEHGEDHSDAALREPKSDNGPLTLPSAITFHVARPTPVQDPLS
jgi:hypothetical protein